MLRKSFVALAAGAALITFTIVDASARGGHGGGGGRGGWGGGGHGFARGMGGGPRVGMGVGRGFVGGPVARGYGYRGFAPRYGFRPYVRPYAFRPFRPRFYGGYGFYGYPYAYYNSGYDSCYRWRRVWTPYGWRLRRFWVCNYRYY